MKSLPFRFGAETYTWFMKDQGRAHAGRLGHMIEVTARAGFSGFSPSHSWMGDMFEADRLERALKNAGLDLAAIALVLPWNLPEETARERAEADATIALLLSRRNTLYRAIARRPPPVGSTADESGGQPQCRVATRGQGRRARELSSQLAALVHHSHGIGLPRRFG
jgi:hypothetical protein